MFQRRSLGLARLTALILFAALAPDTSLRASAIVVSGRVIDSDGSPIAGAEVALQAVSSLRQRSLELLDGEVERKASATVRSSPDGGYRLTVPAPGMWQVEVSASGRVPVRCRLVPLLESVEVPAAVLEPDAGFEVRIEGTDGAPVSGAQVWLRPAPSGEPAMACAEFSRWSSVGRYGSTGEDGMVRLARRPGETVGVHAFAAGYLPADRDDVESGAATLRLRPGTDVTLQVRSALGHPVAHAALLAFPLNWVVTSTDEEGRARLTLPPNEPVQLTLYSASGQVESRAVSLPAVAQEGAIEPVRVPLDWRLAEPIEGTGRVVDRATHEPLAGALVWSFRDPGAFQTSGPDGHFRMTLDRAQYGQILATAPGYNTAWGKPFPGPDRTRLPTLALARTGSFSGRVVDPEGEAVSGAVVRVTSKEFPTTFSEPDGSFRLSGLEVGSSYEIATGASGFAPDYRRVTLEPGLRLEIVLQRGRSVFGRLLTPDQEPVAAARVVLVPITTDPRLRSFSTQTERLPKAESDLNGRFRLDDLPPERCALVARRDGLADAIVREIDLTAEGEPRDLGDLEMDWGLTLRGSVRAQSGEPISGAQITIWSRSNDRVLMELLAEDARGRTVTTNREGEFEIYGLTPTGKFGLSTHHADYVDVTLFDVDPEAEQPLEIVLEEGATLAGQVLDEAGAAVEGLQIRIDTLAHHRQASNGSSQAPAFGVSDADGLFEIEAVPPGEVEFSVTSREGWVVPEPLMLSLEPGEERRDLVVRVSAGATLTGTVRDPDNRPVVGASIHVHSAVSYSDLARPLGRTYGVGGQSDGEGTFRIGGILPEAHQATVTVRHPDFADLEQVVDMRPGSNRVDFRLERGGSIAGRVRNESGEDVPGAEIEITSVSVSSRETRGGPETDTTGAFEIKGLAAGAYELVARKRGFAESSRQKIEVTKGSSHQVTLQLRRGGAIRGRLLGLEPKEYIGVQLFASSKDPNENGYAVGLVGNDGEYTIPNVGFAAGRVFAASEERGQSVSAEFELDPNGGEVRIDLDFGTGSALTGVVLLNGEPLPRAEVLVHELEQGLARGVTGADGRFRLEGLADGVHRIRVSARTTLDHAEIVEIAGDTEITIEIRSVLVSGRVVAEPDHRPMPGARVVASAEDDVFAPFGQAEAMAAVAGAFELSLPPNRRVVLRAVAPGFAGASLELETGAGADISGLELVLGRGHELELEFTLWSGLRPDRVMVALVDEAGRRVMGGTLTGQPSGSFRMDSVPTGNWTLIVASDSSAVVEQRVSIPGPPVAMVLPQGAAIQVEYRGSKLVRTPEVLRLVSSAGRALRLPVAMRTLQNFLFFDQAHLPWVPPGTWQVELVSPTGEVRRKTVVATAGVTTQVIFD